MTTEQLHPLTHRTATYTVGELAIRVRILDTKLSYGRKRYLITPVEGSGEQWIETGLTDF